MNNFTVQIYNDTTKTWVDYTKNAVFPVKLADLLDEQLDEAELTLKHIAEEYFNPLTLVKITLKTKNNAPITNTDFNDIIARAQTAITSSGTENKKYYQTLERVFIVANDTSNEIMGLKVKHGSNTGKKVYNHQIYLIEITKIAEGFIGDALTFTNTLGNDFTGQSQNTAEIHYRGMGTQWNSNVEIPAGSTVYYQGDTAIATNWDSSVNAVSLKYSVNSAFYTVQATNPSPTITVVFR